jgi:hypothetical protein
VIPVVVGSSPISHPTLFLSPGLQVDPFEWFTQLYLDSLAVGGAVSVAHLILVDIFPGLLVAACLVGLVLWTARKRELSLGESLHRATCDALKGTAKDACVGNAKVQFWKSQDKGRRPFRRSGSGVAGGESARSP